MDLTLASARTFAGTLKTICVHTLHLADGINISMDTCARVNQHWRWGVTDQRNQGLPISLDKARYNVPLLLRYENTQGEVLEERST